MRRGKPDSDGKSDGRYGTPDGPPIRQTRFDGPVPELGPTGLRDITVAAVSGENTLSRRVHFGRVFQPAGDAGHTREGSK